MATRLAERVSEHVGEYLAGNATLADLRAWRRGGAITTVDDAGDGQDEQLIHTIELLWSEFEQGDWSEDGLRDRLREAVIDNVHSARG
jgi:hypothetical protein